MHIFVYYMVKDFHTVVVFGKLNDFEIHTYIICTSQSQYVSASLPVSLQPVTKFVEDVIFRIEGGGEGNTLVECGAVTVCMGNKRQAVDHRGLANDRRATGGWGQRGFNLVGWQNSLQTNERAAAVSPPPSLPDLTSRNMQRRSGNRSYYTPL